METPTTPQPFEVEEIRAAVHDLVEGLTPAELHALWQVILAFVGHPPRTPSPTKPPFSW